MTTNVTTKAQWLALAERCETATGIDYLIDVDICASSPGGLAQLPGVWITASLDAITALIERELPRAAWRAVRPLDDRKPQGSIQRRGETFFDIWVDAEAATPALALCAAFCRAMAEKVSHDN
jgi:hypothetical protein